MSGKDANPSDGTYESSTARIYKQFYNSEACLCGCGKAVRGRAKAFVSGHDAALVSCVLTEEYGGAASFVLTHSVGAAASAHWQLTPWQPETAVGQQARGRVFSPLPLIARGFGYVKTSDIDDSDRYDEEDSYDDETAALCSKIVDAGDRIVVAFGDPFEQQRHELAMTTGGPVWREAYQALLNFDKWPEPARTSKTEWSLYRAARSVLETALDTAPGAPPNFEEPAEAARQQLFSKRPDLAVQMLRDATEAYVLDIDSWAHLSFLALRDRRLDDALGFAEAGVVVAERSFPDRFSGVLQANLSGSHHYINARHSLMEALWGLQRFDDAYKVAVDSIWLDPCENNDFCRDLGDIKRRVPWGGC